MGLFLALLLGTAHGAAHGLGPDHCAALASLLAGDRAGIRPHARRPLRDALRIGARFGFGHALALGSLALAAAVFGWLIPEALERSAEAFGGAVLVLLGIVVLVRGRALPLVHRHSHTHATTADDREDHAHWHLHLDGSRQGHGHPHARLAPWIGGALALSGVRGLALALPPMLIAAGSLWPGLAFVVAFGLGVTLSMAGFGVLVGVLRNATTHRWPDRLIGASSVLLGGWWLWTSL